MPPAAFDRVVAAPSGELITAAVADQAIDSLSTPDLVVAVYAEREVVAGAQIDAIIAIAAADAIVALARAHPVVAVASTDVVVTVGAEDDVVAIRPLGDLSRLGCDCHGPAVALRDARGCLGHDGEDRRGQHATCRCGEHVPPTCPSSHTTSLSHRACVASYRGQTPGIESQTSVRCLSWSAHRLRG